MVDSLDENDLDKELDEFIKSHFGGQEDSLEELTQNKKYQLPLKVGKKGLPLHDEEPFIISRFTPKEVYLSERHPTGHEGWDVGGPKGAQVFPIGPGQVVETKEYPKGGKTLKIKHFPDETLISYYAHLDSVTVSVGQYVDLDTVIGTNGNTGTASKTSPHVHLETKLNGSKTDPGNIIGKQIGSFSKKANKINDLVKLANELDIKYNF
jgi:murein DD-endopeptidase MepM/ murein hydrolase activator NlpD